MRLVRTKICQCLKSRDLGCTGTSTSTGTSTGPGTRVDFKCKNRRWSEVFSVFLFLIIFSTIFSTTTAVWMYFIIIILYQGRRVFCTSFSLTIRAINETTEDANVGDFLSLLSHMWWRLIWQPRVSVCLLFLCFINLFRPILPHWGGGDLFFLSTARNHL